MRLSYERWLLGKYILIPESLRETPIKEADFFDGRHRRIFAALRACLLRGTTDTIAVAEVLDERGQLEGIGGVEYLTKIIAAYRPWRLSSRSPLLLPWKLFHAVRKFVWKYRW